MRLPLAAFAASIFSCAMIIGCASSGPAVDVPADALTVATVRHVAGPQPAAQWIARDALPTDALRGDGERALLLEATLRDERVWSLESAPLELANLIVRIDTRDPKQTVISIDNGSASRLAYDLFLSPDGERFRRVPSCPVVASGSAFERWPERMAWFAIANVRVPTADEPGCD
jgi:hypothetical protein